MDKIIVKDQNFRFNEPLHSPAGVRNLVLVRLQVHQVACLLVELGKAVILGEVVPLEAGAVFGELE